MQQKNYTSKYPFLTLVLLLKIIIYKIKINIHSLVLLRSCGTQAQYIQFWKSYSRTSKSFKNNNYDYDKFLVSHLPEVILVFGSRPSQAHKELSNSTCLFCSYFNEIFCQNESFHASGRIQSDFSQFGFHTSRICIFCMKVYIRSWQTTSDYYCRCEFCFVKRKIKKIWKEKAKSMKMLQSLCIISPCPFYSVWYQVTYSV